MRGKFGLLSISLGAFITALVLSEILLMLLGFKSGYSQKSKQLMEEYQDACEIKTFDEAIAKGWGTGDLGTLRSNAELGYTLDLDPHGFNDPKNFHHDFSNDFRVLVLGDSFTQGASADPDQGFVPLLNQSFKEKGVLFFNTGVGGYGQNNQVAVLKKYFDVIKPQLVILGFYPGNDFTDNLTGLDRHTAFPGKWLVNYEILVIDDEAAVRKRSKDELWKQYQGFIGCERAMDSFWLKSFMLQTRLGTQIWVLGRKAKHQIRSLREKRIVGDAGYFADWKAPTRNLLSEMQEFLSHRSVPLWVMVIPQANIDEKNINRTSLDDEAYELMDDLDISLIDLTQELTVEDYYFKPKGSDWGAVGHWNNDGHKKVYEKLKSRIEKTVQ